ncbi:MAG: hypothetical protein QOJ32_498 [Frankiaceae bacterium]|jgi:hypothetical protein|nr:hypothetical protein [Frankiaceae bacterium]MDQ1648711.1 hypothetical protein [Frankiaceae bacterium]
MTAIGLAIMIVAGIVTVDVVLENTRNTDASVVGQTVANVDLGGFFTAGVLVGVALMLGLMLLLAGLRRARRQRLERKELARSYEGTAAQAESLQEERDRLAAELESERRARASRPAAGTVGGESADTRTRPVGAAPVYPGDAVGAGAGAGAASGGAATATQDRTTQDRTTQEHATPDHADQEHATPDHAPQEHAKRSFKDRLLGR